MDKTNPLAVLRKKVADQQALVIGTGKYTDDMRRGATHAYAAVLTWIDELMSPQALPCPFCGCVEVETIVTLVPEWYACCNGCAAKGPLQATEAEARAAWNTRA